MKIQLNRVIYYQCFSLKNIRTILCHATIHHAIPYAVHFLFIRNPRFCAVIQTSYARCIYTHFYFPVLCMKSLMRASSYTLAWIYLRADNRIGKKQREITLHFFFKARLVHLKSDSFIGPSWFALDGIQHIIQFSNNLTY